MSKFKFSVGPWNVHSGADSYGPPTRNEISFDEKLKSDIEKGIYSYGMRVRDTHLSIQKASEWIMENAGANSKYEFIHKSKHNL